MKIFSVQPIKVNECTFNREFLSKTHTSSSYQSDFDYDFENDSQNTFTIIFDLLYTVGDNFNENILPSNRPNEFIVELDSEAGSGDVFLSYNYSCQFDFESEGFDEDVLSLNAFLDDFYTHIKTFLNQPGLELVKEKEENLREYQPLEDTVLEIIDNLRENDMYEFKVVNGI